MKKSLALLLAVTMLCSSVAVAADNLSNLSNFYDPRSSGVEIPIRNQGNTDTCWAFAASACLEAFAQTRGNPIDVSEQHMRYALSADGGNTLGFDRRNADGGDISEAWDYFTRAEGAGPVPEENDPFVDTALIRTAAVTAAKPRAGLVTDTVLLPNLPVGTIGSEPGRQTLATIKKLIRTSGAAEVSYRDETDGYNTNRTDNPYFLPGADKTNHSVAIIGWNDDYPAANFLQNPGGNGAFLCKNSWGAAWGDNGCFWLSYYNTLTDIGTITGYDPHFSGAIYDYAPFADADWRYWNGNGTIWAAVLFDCTEKTALDQVQFQNQNGACDYTFYAAAGSTTSRSDVSLIEKAKENLPTKGHLTDNGYVTVDVLDVSVNAGQTLAIVLQLDAPSGATRKLPIESNAAQAVEHDGECYCSVDGKSWKNMAESLVLRAVMRGGIPKTDPVRSDVKSVSAAGKTYTIPLGSTLRLPTADAKHPAATYTFLGYDDAEGRVTGTDGVLTFADRHIGATLVAVYAPKSFPVTFKAGKGKIGKAKKKSTKVFYGTTLGKLPKATRKGYKFLGWQTKKGKIVSRHTVLTTKKLVLTAKWKKKKR